MRRRLSYANVTATLALVFAMSGGALAANHYLITSTKQVSPKVLKKLTGKAGKAGTNGANGAAGATGITGAQGLQGKEGPQGKTGEKGQTGEAGTTVAYADFNSSGGIQETSPAKNLSAANVEKVATGVYCFKNLSFVPNTAVVSADNSFGANETVVSVRVAPVLSDCNPGETVRVRTTLSKTGVLTDEAFTIWLD
jgi:hypothetical protein